MFALDHRRELAGAWGWMLASGIVDLVLATIILAGLPGTAAWAIGLLVGINLTFALPCNGPTGSQDRPSRAYSNLKQAFDRST